MQTEHFVLFKNLSKNNTRMLICTFKKLLIFEGVPAACASHKEVPLLMNINVSDKGQNLQSLFCVQMHAEVWLKLL